MRILLGVGTYILRNDMPRDYAANFEKIGQIGYDGAELAGFWGRTAEEIGSALGKSGLRAVGNHLSVHEFLAHFDRIAREHVALGCRYLTLGCSPDEVAEADEDRRAFDALAQSFTEASRIARDGGFTPLYHNHDFDMRGAHPFAERLLDAAPLLSFEPDVGWMAYAGKDPALYLEKYRKRCPVIHLKDIYAEDVSALKPGAAGSCTEYDPANGAFAFCPTGYGIVNMPRLLPFALKCAPDWLIVDHDHAYARDPFSDLRLSHDYVRAMLALHDIS